MQIILKNIFKFLPSVTRVLFLLFIQLLLLGINLVGIFHYARLYTYRDLYKVIFSAAVTSLLYDSIKMLPLGSWSLTFFIVAIPAMLCLNILKMQGENELNSWPATFMLITLTVISTLLQSFLLMKISGQKNFDFGTIYSIVALTTLYLVIQKLIHKKETRLLLD